MRVGTHGEVLLGWDPRMGRREGGRRACTWVMMMMISHQPSV